MREGIQEAVMWSGSLIFFLCGRLFFKVFIEFITILFLFYVFFDHEACGILAPRPGIQPAPPALEGEVLTTGPPGKSLEWVLKDV